MKKQFKILILTLSIAGISLSATAQVPKKPTLIMLPDGKIIGFNLVDSVKNAWGTDQVTFRHNQEDDEKGILHLQRKTIQQIEAKTSSDQRKKELLGKAAPPFIMKDLLGRKVSLSDFRGRVVVLNFWFVACPVCVEEMPELNKLYGQYSKKKVTFLALGLDNAQVIKKFLQSHPFKYTMLTLATSASKDYHVVEFPVSFVIDKNGNVRLITGGDANIRNLLSKEIDKLL